MGFEVGPRDKKQIYNSTTQPLGTLRNNFNHFNAYNATYMTCILRNGNGVGNPRLRSTLRKNLRPQLRWDRNGERNKFPSGDGNRDGAKIYPTY